MVLAKCFVGNLIKIGTSALQSNFSWVTNGKYIFCLPDHLQVKDTDEILKYQLDIRHKPCNFVEIMSIVRAIFYRSKN